MKFDVAKNSEDNVKFIVEMINPNRFDQRSIIRTNFHLEKRIDLFSPENFEEIDTI